MELFPDFLTLEWQSAEASHADSTQCLIGEEVDMCISTSSPAGEEVAICTLAKMWRCACPLLRQIHWQRSGAKMWGEEVTMWHLAKKWYPAPNLRICAPRIYAPRINVPRPIRVVSIYEICGSMYTGTLSM